MSHTTSFRRLAAWMRCDSSESRLQWRMFWVGLIVRVVFITVAHTYHIKPRHDHFEFGFEMGRIARALALGKGFADPIDGPSGPTAWTPPLYPLLLAGVFKLFGIYSTLSAWVILTLNSVFSAATAPAAYQLARLVFAKKTGTRATSHGIALWSGWLCALYPAAMQYAIHWIWDMALTTCFFTWMLVVALRLRAGYGTDEQPVLPDRAIRLWLVFGCLWGLISLSNSSLLTFVPFCGLWIVWPILRTRPRNPARLLLAARNAMLAGICCLTLMAPWMIRNALVFKTFIPMRSNFGAEFYESVQPANRGFPWGAIFAQQRYDPKFARYQKMGELAFCRAEGEKAKAILRAYPLRTLGYACKRMWFYWAGVPHGIDGKLPSLLNEAVRQLDYCFLSLASLLGLALAFRRRIPAAWLFFWMFAVIPLVYYAITVQARFRAPLEPAMCILIVYLFQSAERRNPQTAAPKLG